MRIIGVYKTLDMYLRPSELLGIKDEYVAFCFDEACAYIIARIQGGEEPVYGNKDIEQAHGYSKPSDLYKKYSV